MALNSLPSLMPAHKPMPNTVHIVELPYQADSFTYAQAMHKSHGFVWLDSGIGPKHSARWDILSAQPTQVLCNPSKHALQQCINELGELSCPLELPFISGAIGYFNYEAKHASFNIAQKEDACASYWGIFDWALIQDHKLGKSYAVFHPSWAQNTIEQRVASILTLTPTNTQFSVDSFQANTHRDDYSRALKQVHSYITEGDCYQINYAQRFDARFHGSDLAAYKVLRNSLPSPYSAFIKLGPESVLSLSPEQFIQVNQGLAQTKPIKGTSKRGTTPEQDTQLACDLLSSEKNRAENLMIVDLLRNDFSLCCEAWSVKVDKLFDLESYANVHHLVSTVSGTLNRDTSALSFIESCFPGGSITGAPKKRAMEIINELEPCARNIYCGSIGYFSVHGRTDTNIAIRTLLIKEDSIHCWGGGGIVADSTDQEEYDESVQKVGVLMSALEDQSAANITIKK